MLVGRRVWMIGGLFWTTWEALCVMNLGLAVGGCEIVEQMRKEICSREVTMEKNLVV